MRCRGERQAQASSNAEEKSHLSAVVIGNGQTRSSSERFPGRSNLMSDYSAGDGARATYSEGFDQLVVVLQAEVRDQLLSLQVTESVFQLHQLDEQVVLGVEPGNGHGGLEVEAEPFLDA